MFNSVLDLDLMRSKAAATRGLAPKWSIVGLGHCGRSSSREEMYDVQLTILCRLKYLSPPCPRSESVPKRNCRRPQFVSNLSLKAKSEHTVDDEVGSLPSC